ncbi:MAG: hypothetical protein N2Z63_10670 [Thiobacillaceae bacterium]|nr:hypothetical protein [Thiobacillaceae bacterium]MDW8324463.1 hypothetical protein [Burkholderiales bacterium]
MILTIVLTLGFAVAVHAFRCGERAASARRTRDGAVRLGQDRARPRRRPLRLGAVWGAAFVALAAWAVITTWYEYNGYRPDGSGHIDGVDVALWTWLGWFLFGGAVVVAVARISFASDRPRSLFTGVAAPSNGAWTAGDDRVG